MKITFMTTLGRNVGDEFIRHGIRTALDAAGIQYDPLYVCKHDLTTLFRPIEDETVRVHDKFWDTDLFIQAGAPVYWRNKDGSSSLTSPWYKYLWEERILSGKKKVWNVGAGSCQAWDEGANAFLSDGACLNFAKQTLETCELTTTRDVHAFDILGIKAKLVACPAFLAALGWHKVQKRPGLIGVNFMPLGCHHDLAGSFNQVSWIAKIESFLSALRLRGRLLFIAHDLTEAGFMKQFSQPSERVFWSPSWRDYMDVYGSCSSVVANRIHGAVCAAGFGTPAVILGEDTRAFIGMPCGVKAFRSSAVTVPEILSWLWNKPADPNIVLKQYIELFKNSI